MASHQVTKIAMMQNLLQDILVAKVAYHTLVTIPTDLALISVIFYFLQNLLRYFYSITELALFFLDRY
jgi:hypothetical protein